VPAAEREAIFEPFYRAPSATVDAGRVGLGLAIARRLAAAQGGTLVYYAREGGGSAFTLRLPRTEVAETSAETVQRYAALSSRASARDLL